MIKIKVKMVKDFSFAKGVICAYAIEKVVDLILVLLIWRDMKITLPTIRKDN